MRSDRPRARCLYRPRRHRSPGGAGRETRLSHCAATGIHRAEREGTARFLRRAWRWAATGPGKPQPPRRARRIEQGHVTAARTAATAYDTSRVCSKAWYRFAMSKQPQQPAVTGTGQTRGHTSASPRCCASASPRENSYPVMQRPRSPAFARTTAWPARPQLMPCMSFRMPGSYTRSPDSATTSALTSFPGFANRAASFRTVSQAARKRCLPGLRYARYYLRGVAAARNA